VKIDGNEDQNEDNAHPGQTDGSDQDVSSVCDISTFSVNFLCQAMW
jgi:hypothetical protein